MDMSWFQRSSIIRSISVPGNFLALDLGAESGRAIVGTLDNGVLNLTETHRFLNNPIMASDGLHWDVNSLWNEIQIGIRKSAAQFQLSSLALDAWGVDFALLDHQGELLENPFHYRDSRTDGMLDIAISRISRKQVFDQTGNQFLQINTLFQLLALAENQPALLKKAATFLTIPDLFNYWLTGAKVCEFTNATTTQCFDPIKRDWAKPLLETLHIPTRMFPQIVEPGNNLGNMVSELTVQVGVDKLPVIAPACHDTGSAVVAVPADNRDFVWLSSGTWSIMGIETDSPCLDQKALDFNFTNEGGVFGTWRLSKNIMGLWLIQECKREWGVSYDEIAQLASEAQPFIAVIDPDDDIFLRSGGMINRIQKYCEQKQQNVPNTIGEISRVIFESLSLKYRFILDRLEQLTNKKLSPIHIIGGGTQNRLLNQFTADSTNRKVISGPVEATAIGNILMQAITLGQIVDMPDARAIVRNSFQPGYFQPNHSNDWDEAYKKLLRLGNYE